MKRNPKPQRKKYASSKAKLVFYGMRTTNTLLGGRILFRKYFVAPENPDRAVCIELELPDMWYERKKGINPDEEMNKLAKKFFPKAETFMFYNRVSCNGIIPPPPAPPKCENFTLRKTVK